MKIFSSLILAMVAAADTVPTYSDYSIGTVKYIEKQTTAGGCKACIDKIGKGEFSNICYGKGSDKNSVYCCNSSPPEPPLSNSPNHDYVSYLDQVNTYLEYHNKNNLAKADSHEYYCPIDGDQCTPDIKMHNALHKCFTQDGGDNGLTKDNFKEKCQNEDGTTLFGADHPNPVKTAGRLDGDTTKQFPQDGFLVYGNNETQTIQSLQPKIKAEPGKACYWEIKNDYMKKYIRLQDMYVKFKEIKGASVYITSFFRDDRESNTTYPIDVEESLKQDTNITFEMYNTTFIYMVPDNAVSTNSILFDFWVYQTAEFQFGTDYTLISKLISGAGGGILIICVITYLDGPSTIFKWIKNQKEERDRIAKEELALKKQGGKDAQLLDGKKGGKQGDQDTQKSNDEMSEEDINYNQLANEDPAVHEGGRPSRPGSNGSDARPQMIRRGVNEIDD